MSIIVGMIDRCVPVIVDLASLDPAQFATVTLNAEYRLEHPVGFPSDISAPGLGLGTAYPDETVTLVLAEANALVDAGAASFV